MTATVNLGRKAMAMLHPDGIQGCQGAEQDS